LQAESILIERIPGKSTIGIEVPNTKREVIALREILESPEFHGLAIEVDDCDGVRTLAARQGRLARDDAALPDCRV